MQKSTNDKNQHMVNEKFILWEVLMKKKLLSLLLASAIVVSMVCACGSDKSSELSQTVKDTKETEEKKLVSVTLNEVAHSIFYAPMYVAIEEGYFEDEGIDLTLVTGFGARPSGRNALQKINKLDRRVFVQVDLLDRGSPEGSAVLRRQRSI